MLSRTRPSVAVVDLFTCRRLSCCIFLIWAFRKIVEESLRTVLSPYRGSCDALVDFPERLCADRWSEENFIVPPYRMCCGLLCEIKVERSSLGRCRPAAA